jgi:signal transduction histidine kinase
MDVGLDVGKDAAAFADTRPDPLSEFLEGRIWRRAWLSSVFLVLDLPVGIVFGSVIVTLAAVSASLTITFLLGIPLAWLTLRVSRLFAMLERHRFASLLGTTIDSPVRPVESVPWLTQLKHDVRSRTTWKELGYHVLLVPVAAMTYCIVVIGWALPLLMISAPLLTLVLPNRYAELGLTRIHAGSAPVIVCAVGLLLSVLSPRIILWTTRQRISMATALLGADESTQLEARVAELETSRTALLDAVDAERRRIERDLHDGAQQRLVAVAMNLGMAKNKLGKLEGIPADVQELIDSAHIESKRAIAELRDVARGVHPAILEDRGLGPALSSLAARCPVPVRVDIHTEARVTRALEAVAYYVVAEALTNIAKHAHASRVTITVSRSRDWLRVVISDDGLGGAAMGAPGGLGGGLAGLRDRVTSVDGLLTLTSPVGGPTTLTAELPCAS